MLRNLLLLIVSLGGLHARAPAQLHLGVNLGGRVSVHATDLVPHLQRSGVPRRGSIGVGCCAPTPPYRSATHRVWVSGWWESVRVAAVYEWRYDACGRAYQVMVCPAHFRRVWHPGQWRCEERPQLVGC